MKDGAEIAIGAMHSEFVVPITPIPSLIINDQKLFYLQHGSAKLLRTVAAMQAPKYDEFKSNIYVFVGDKCVLQMIGCCCTCRTFPATVKWFGFSD